MSVAGGVVLVGLRPGSRDRVVVLRLAALSVVAAAGLVVLYAVAVRTATGQLLDTTAFNGHDLGRHGLRHRSWQLLSHITVASLAVAVLGIMAVAFVRRRPRLALAAGAVVVGSVVAAQVLKYWVLTRPGLTTSGGAPEFNTFPSGHTTIAVSVAVGFVLVVPDRLRGVAALGGGLYAMLIGVATQTAGWHRVSDAVGSYLLVVSVTAAVMAALVAWRGSGRSAPVSGMGFVLPVGLLFLVGAGSLLGAAPGYLRTVRLVRRSGVPTDPALLLRAFDAGVNAVNAAAALGMVLLVVCLVGVALDTPAPRSDHTDAVGGAASGEGVA